MISVVLSVVMMLSVFTSAAFAVNENEAGAFISKVTEVEGKYSQEVRGGASKWFYERLNGLLMGAVKLISGFFSVPDSWVYEDKYVTENFYMGTADFLSQPARGAKWSLGYSSASILEGQDVLDNAHYVAGSIAFTDKFATEVIDDLKCRSIAINDGSSRGTALFIVLDAYGISIPTVKRIRAELADFAKSNGVVSINVCVLHQHSAVDTFGMNGNIFEMALLNPWRTLFGAEDRVRNGANEEFMSNMVSVCVETAKQAVEALEPGALYYTKADMSDYHIDKRDPQVNDENFNIFVFDPDNKGSGDTYIIESMIHCVSFGASTTTVSGDYPYYLEKALNSSGANMLMLMGAQQSTSLNRSSDHPALNDSMSTVEKVAAIGEDMADRILAAADSMKVEVNPLLNIRSAQLKLAITNPILALAGKAGMFKESVVKTGFGKYAVVTEIGYMELGDSFAFTMIPGELAPEIAYGGTLPAQVSWNGGSFDYPTLQQLAGDRKLIPLGLCNDQIGYIIPDNNYMPLIVEESDSLEFVSLGSETASALVKSFEGLIGGVHS